MTAPRAFSCRWPTALLLLAVLLIGGTAYAQSTVTAAEQVLRSAMAAARSGYNIPAISALVWQNGATLAATIGVRSAQASVTATDADHWHIGSCGKLMTSVMILRLVDRGVLQLDAPIARSLPMPLQGLVHPRLRGATLAQLLSHTAGIADVDLEKGIPARDATRLAPVLQSAPADQVTSWQAAAITLERAPEFAPGEVFQYSNLGYVVAGLVASHATGRSWQQLMREEVFQPLKLSSAGFGAPGRAGAVDQPFGHQAGWRWLVVPVTKSFAPSDVGADFPAFYGPAGLIHIGLKDWGVFLRMILAGVKGESGFLTKASFARLLTPVKAKNFDSYGLGVRVSKAPIGVGSVFEHTGSNGKWRATFRVSVERDQVVALAANSGGDEVDKAFAEIIGRLDRDQVAPRK